MPCCRLLAKLCCRLRALGKRTVFLSNNPTHTRHEYAGKLTRLGVPTPQQDIVNSSAGDGGFPIPPHAGESVFVVGEQPLKDELAAAGFQLCEQPGEIEAVIASFDRTFDYR